MSKTIYVYENFLTSSPSLIGKLFVDTDKHTETYSFEYSNQWLDKNNLFLDPDLKLYQGRQYSALSSKMFGIFSDSCPDRWGRLLMKRKESIISRKENRKPRELTESDYLLGVYDKSRMGALRFSLSEDGPFESSDEELTTPPWVSLRELESASISFEKNDENNEIWLNQLLAPGSSLGGARPKATVQDTEGSLWIAKFPSKHDEYNIGAWEKTAHDLAEMCDIDVPSAKLETFSDNGSTFITKRFDRNGNKRIHFSSAMCLLGKNDGDISTSYTDIAEFITAYGSSPQKDLLELWKRIIFNMAISNTDDHLRNHGFLYTNKGWRISPMYDVNPIPFGDTLSLNINKNDSSIDIGLALETSDYYGLDLIKAKGIAKEIILTVKNQWEKTAKANGLDRNSIEYMRPAFDVCYRNNAI